MSNMTHANKKTNVGEKKQTKSCTPHHHNSFSFFIHAFVIHVLFTLNQASHVSSESDPAWCIGPMRWQCRSSAIFCKPPCRPSMLLTMYLMSYIYGVEEKKRENRSKRSKGEEEVRKAGEVKRILRILHVVHSKWRSEEKKKKESVNNLKSSTYVTSPLH